MAADAAEPWRRTGRKASDDHLFGLEKGVILEIAVYHDDGTRQGQAVVELLDAGELGTHGAGKIHTVQFVAIEDEYFDWWSRMNSKAGRYQSTSACLQPRAAKKQQYTAIRYTLMCFGSCQGSPL